MYYNESQAKTYEKKIKGFMVECLSDNEKKAYKVEYKKQKDIVDKMFSEFGINIMWCNGQDKCMDLP